MDFDQGFEQTPGHPMDLLNKDQRVVDHRGALFIKIFKHSVGVVPPDDNVHGAVRGPRELLPKAVNATATSVHDNDVVWCGEHIMDGQDAVESFRQREPCFEGLDITFGEGRGQVHTNRCPRGRVHSMPNVHRNKVSPHVVLCVPRDAILVVVELDDGIGPPPRLQQHVERLPHKAYDRAHVNRCDGAASLCDQQPPVRCTPRDGANAALHAALNLCKTVDAVEAIKEQRSGAQRNDKCVEVPNKTHRRHGRRGRAAEAELTALDIPHIKTRAGRENKRAGLRAVRTRRWLHTRPQRQYDFVRFPGSADNSSDTAGGDCEVRPDTVTLNAVPRFRNICLYVFCRERHAPQPRSWLRHRGLQLDSPSQNIRKHERALHVAEAHITPLRRQRQGGDIARCEMVVQSVEVPRVGVPHQHLLADHTQHKGKLEVVLKQRHGLRDGLVVVLLHCRENVRNVVRANEQ
eukprot:PhM_4_TR2648/c0_g1_i1/m.76411